MIFLNLSVRVALLAFLTIPNDIIATEVYPLYAGQNTLIGTVEVTSNPDDDCSINVEYIIDDESAFCITKTHLVSLNRNPKVGRKLENEH
jgi:hypothetical protein